VHLSGEHPRKVAVARLLNSLNGISAQLLRLECCGQVNRHIMRERF
jgi:hypothetical protein